MNPFLIIYIFFCLNANADLTIKKLNKDTGRVVVEFTDEEVVDEGDYLRISKLDDSCDFKVEKIKKNFIFGKNSCINKIQVGDKVIFVDKDELWTKEDIEEVEEKKVKPKSKKTKKNYGVGLSIGLDLASKVDVDGVANGSPFVGTMTSNSPFSIAAHILRADKGKFGAYTLLEYQFSRKCISYDILGVNYDCGGINISTLTLTPNLAYGISDHIKMYLGINWPALVSATNTINEFTGDLGYQAGAILFFNDNLFGVVEYKVINIFVSWSTIGDVGEYDANMSGINLRLGVVF